MDGRSTGPVSPGPEPLSRTDLAGWEWQSWAACKGVPTDWFFPPDREREKVRSSRIARAKSYCARCPVVSACRAYALQTYEPFGVWGGLSEEERAQVVERS